MPFQATNYRHAIRQSGDPCLNLANAPSELVQFVYLTLRTGVFRRRHCIPLVFVPGEGKDPIDV